MEESPLSPQQETGQSWTLVWLNQGLHQALGLDPILPHRQKSLHICRCCPCTWFRASMVSTSAFYLHHFARQFQTTHVPFILGKWNVLSLLEDLYAWHDHMMGYSIIHTPGLGIKLRTQLFLLLNAHSIGKRKTIFHHVVYILIDNPVSLFRQCCLSRDNPSWFHHGRSSGLLVRKMGFLSPSALPIPMGGWPFLTCIALTYNGFTVLHPLGGEYVL